MASVSITVPIEMFNVSLHTFECVDDVLTVGDVQVVAVCRFVSLMAWRAVCVTQVAWLFFSFTPWLVMLCVVILRFKF